MDESIRQNYIRQSYVLLIVLLGFLVLLFFGILFFKSSSVVSVEQMTLPLALLYSIFSLFLLTYLMLANKQLSKSRQKSKILDRQKTEYILKGLNDIFSLRTDLENLFIEFALEGSSDSEADDPYDESSGLDYKDISVKYLDFCVSKLKQIMDFVTDDDCAVTIKILIPNPGGGSLPPHIMTYTRDKQSDFSRMDFDRDYGSFVFSDQTAFRYLLLDEPESEIFFSNDLERLQKSGDYTNVNPKWKSFYNATAVVPIKNTKMRKNEEVLGFLCIDNRRGGMHVEATVEVMKIIASSIYYALRTVAYFEVDRGQV